MADDKVKSKSLDDGNKLGYYEKIVDKPVEPCNTREAGDDVVAGGEPVLPYYDFTKLPKEFLVQSRESASDNINQQFKKYELLVSEMTSTIRTYLEDSIMDYSLQPVSYNTLKILTSRVYPDFFQKMNKLNCKWYITSGEDDRIMGDDVLCIMIFLEED